MDCRRRNMRVKSGFVLRKIGTKYMAVPVGERTRDVHGMIALNETGAFIWQLMEEERTEEEIVGKLLEEYEVDRDTAAGALGRFRAKLAEEGVLGE